MRGTTEGAVVSWSGVPQARSYDLYAAPEESFTPETVEDAGGIHVSGVQSPHPLSDLTGGRAWYVRVTSTNASGEGIASPVASAYVIGTGSNSLGPSLEPVWSHAGEGGGILGVSAALGDLDGDGMAEVIAGEPFSSVTATEAGRVLVFRDILEVSGETESAALENGREQARFGYDLAVLGDVNGDGLHDLAVGAPFDGNPEPDEGTVRVYAGRDEELAPEQIWEGEEDLSGAQYGKSVSAMGDVNSDGYDEVLVGVPFFDGDGKAVLYVGGEAGPGASPAWETAVGSQTGSQVGRSVAGGADVNCDGAPDVLVGIPVYDAPLGSGAEGRVEAFYGVSDPDVDWFWEHPDGDARLGATVASAGDLNGDGCSDMAVVAAYDGTQSSRVYVFYGSAEGPADTPDWEAETFNTNVYDGAVAGVGDLNQDGYDDLLVAGPQKGTRWATLYAGSADGLGDEPIWTAEGDIPIGYWGATVHGGLDATGDGFPDVVVGIPDYVKANADDGLIAVYAGPAQETPGLSVADLQVTRTGRDVAARATVVLRSSGTHRCTWFWGDETSDLSEPCGDTVEAPMHTYEKPGTYDLRLEVRDAQGAYASVAHRIAVP